ncbi:hypothetical protein [Pedobacter sp. SYP-B3415]|uniref:hypothetical protein n=1 Tax=Pedobacter sp. SYP-B3415 TaxID=2496641 RepID=UPI00101E0D7E|nr:hypothetical protein [Pedobacter sp. SYP-B3415]
MKRLIGYLFALIAVLGCKKDNSPAGPDSQPEKKSKLKSTRTLNHNKHFIQEEFFYNAEGLLQKEVNTDESGAGGGPIIQEYFYKNGLPDYSLVTINNKTSSRMDYHHTDGFLTSVDYAQRNEEQAMEYAYTHEYDYLVGKLLKMGYAKQSTVYRYTLVAYRGKNFAEIRDYSGEGKVLNSTKFEYDNNPNPYFGNPGRLYQPEGFNANNIVKVTFTDFAQAANNYEQVYAYDYNPQGMPVNRYIVYNGTKTLSQVYSYYP